jgi:hypothetical protein
MLWSLHQRLPADNSSNYLEHHKLSHLHSESKVLFLFLPSDHTKLIIEMLKGITVLLVLSLVVASAHASRPRAKPLKVTCDMDAPRPDPQKHFAL